MRTLPSVLQFLLASVVVSPAFAAASRSPFVPHGQPDAVAPTENAPLELRGILQDNGETLFNVFNPAGRQSFWVKLNEPGQNFSVTSYDGSDSVSLSYQGRTLNLALQKARIAPLAAPAPLPVPAPAPAAAQAGRPAAPQVPVLNPTAADDATRLESIAAEVRRRRLLRAGQQPGTTPPATVPAPQPQRPAQPPR